MVISIHNSYNALGIQRNSASSTGNLRNITQRLSSGVRINSAKDDAANLTLSKKFDYTTSGLSVANRNIDAGIGRLQTFSGYLETISESLQNVRELAVQAANGVYTPNERQLLDDNVQEIIKEVEIGTKSANAEIGAKQTNVVGFINEIKSLKAEEITAAGYNEAHIINTAAEFVSKVSADLGGDFILASDIDMSELGTLSNSAITGTFIGSFDGNGYSISNLSIDTGGAAVDNIGLFAATNGFAELKNIDVKNVNISALNSDKVGGLVGWNYRTNISNSYSTGTVAGDNYVGGLVGLCQNVSTVESSYSTVAVSGNTRIGGLMGLNGNNSKINNSYATGTIIGGSSVGGLVGVSYNGSISNSYATGTVSGDSDIGGLIGLNQHYSTLSNSYSTGTVAGFTRVGGLAGSNNRNSSISNSYSTAAVTGNSQVGGLVGNTYDNATINNSYSAGNVIGQLNTGGLVGYNNTNSTISNSYTTSNVQGTTNVGGFVGQNVGGATSDATNFYYNNMTTDGVGSLATIDKAAATVSWDTSTWNLNNGTPSLNWERGDKDFSIHAGAGVDSYDLNHLGLNFAKIGGLDFDLSSGSGARSAILSIDNAINHLSAQRSETGAAMNTLELMKQSNTNRNHNLQNSNSTIKDTDMAIEAAKLSKNQILQQSTVSMMQQAQQMSSNLILSLI